MCGSFSFHPAFGSSRAGIDSIAGGDIPI